MNTGVNLGRGSKEALAQTLEQLTEMLEAASRHDLAEEQERATGFFDRAESHRARAKALRFAVTSSMREIAQVMRGT